MFKRLQGKGKITLDKEDFRGFFYTFLNYMSEEWREIKDKRIKYLEDYVRELEKQTRKLTNINNKTVVQNNQALRATNVEMSTMRTRIQKLEMELREANK